MRQLPFLRGRVRGFGANRPGAEPLTLPPLRGGPLPLPLGEGHGFNPFISLSIFFTAAASKLATG